MSVTLNGRLPSDDRNGLGSIAAAAVDKPDAMFAVVALVTTTRITTNTESGDVIPTLAVRAIEGLELSTEDGAEVERLLRRGYERRTGKVELPLDMEREFDTLSGLDDDDA